MVFSLSRDKLEEEKGEERRRRCQKEKRKEKRLRMESVKVGDIKRPIPKERNVLDFTFIERGLNRGRCLASGTSSN